MDPGGVSRKKNEEKLKTIREEENKEEALMREFYPQSLEEEDLAFSGPPKFKFLPTTTTLRKMILKACYTKREEISIFNDF